MEGRKFLAIHLSERFIKMGIKNFSTAISIQVARAIMRQIFCF